MAKITISINDDLLKRLDDYLQKNYISRSAFFSNYANNFLKSNDVLDSVSDVAVLLRKIDDKGLLDDSDHEQLDNLESMLKVYGSSLLKR